MTKREGQAAIEYLVMTGVALLALLVLLSGVYTRLSNTETDLDVSSVHNAVNKLKEATDFVYSHGHPTRITLSVYFPGNIEPGFTYINGTTINFAVTIADSYTDIWAATKGNVAWDLYGGSAIPTQEGTYLLIVESTLPGDPYNGTINIYRQT